MTAFRWGVRTHKGQVRATNQDRALVTDRLLAVADGMGGHRGGEVASRVALEALRDVVDELTTDSVVEGFDHANEVVLAEARDDPKLRGMGTTMCAVALVRSEGADRIAVVNVGDSRVYRIHDGDMAQLSEDHSLVEDMVRGGRLTPEEALRHPQRNILTKAIGIDAGLHADAWEVRPRVGDRYLLCSDGLVNEVSDDRISATLRRLDDPGDAADELVRLANEAGGNDNVTVVVVDVVEDGRGGHGGRGVVGEDADVDLAGFSVATGEQDVRHEMGRGEIHGDPVGGRIGRMVRRLGWRSGLLLFGAVAVAVAVVASVGWYARNTFYVGLDGDEVAIFRGRPGGVLWFDPTIVEGTGIPLDDLSASARADLEDGNDQATLGDARRFVENLETQIASMSDQTPTTQPPTTQPTSTRPTSTPPTVNQAPPTP